MMEVIEKILFFIFILPYMMLKDGLDILNRHTVKNGWPKATMQEALLVLLILLMFTVLGLGYRW